MGNTTSSVNKILTNTTVQYSNKNNLITVQYSNLNDVINEEYLPWYDKFFCTYCAYANGFLLYASAIAGETEKYWCGIKHQRARIKELKDEEKNYLKYGDKKSFKKIEKESEKSKD